MFFTPMPNFLRQSKQITMKQLRIKGLLIDISEFVEAVKPASLMAASEMISKSRYPHERTDQLIKSEARRLVQYLVCRLMEEQYLVGVLNYHYHCDDSMVLIKQLRLMEVDFERIFRSSMSICRLTDIPDFVSIQVKLRDLWISMR